ncbi:MAG: zinc ABC transporter substrate-binding protein [bacterium]|nr:zinc ABC transporter substrate-binding protein [bacterium]
MSTLAKKWGRGWLLGFLLGVGLLLGCGKPTTGDAKKLVATTGMVADLVQRVAGDHFQVEALMGPGVDPHLYKPTEGDLNRLRSARAVFYSGLHLEGKMVEVFKRLQEAKPSVPLGESVPVSELIDRGNGVHDPHIWFDPVIWKLSLPIIAGTLTKLDSANKTEYETNAKLAAAEIDSLHQWIVARIAELPPERRILVTSHDAFSYFGKRYGVKVIGLQGISTVSEYGLQDVTRMVDQVVAEKIPALFVESSVPRKSMEAVQRGAQEKGHPVKIGGELFSDAMGAQNTPEGNYLGMVRHNVNTIVDALK